jgi:hypothetical protein
MIVVKTLDIRVDYTEVLYIFFRTEQQAELDTLVEAELRAATDRTATLMQQGSS